MRRHHPHRAIAAVLAVSLTLAVSLDGQAAPAAPSEIAAGGADADAAADPLGWPQADIVSITRRGGLNETVKAAALQAAAAANAPATYGRGFQLGLRRVRRGAAVLQQSSGDGWGIPMGVTALPLEVVGSVMGRAVSGPLAQNSIVISQTTATMRGAQVGDVFDFITPGGWIASFLVGMVVPDELVGGTEILMSTTQADFVGMASPTRVIIYGQFDRAVLAGMLAAFGVSTDSYVRVSRSWEPAGPDSTLGLVATKQLLGEFDVYYAGLATSQWVAVNPTWKSIYLPVNRRLYSTGILARCNNVLHAALEAALAEVQATLPQLVNSSPNSASQSTGLDIANANTYGGCSTGSARLSRVGVAGGIVSRHSWGQALDVSTVSNCQGCVPAMDCRIVRIFRKHGFAWGGNFLTPDGMHFEWVGEPRDGVAGGARYCPNIVIQSQRVDGWPSGSSLPSSRETMFADDGWLGDIDE